MQLLFYLAIFCSIISQADGIVETSMGTLLKLSWVLPFFVCLIGQIKALSHKRLYYSIFLAILFLLYCFTLESFTRIQYLGNDMYNICVSVLFMITSYLFWRKKGTAHIANNISIILIISAVILAISFLPTLMGSSIFGREYAVQNKNNIAFLLMSCGVFVFFNYKTKSKIAKYLVNMTIVLLFVYVFILKSRATLLGMLLIISYYIYKSENKKFQLTAIITILTTIIIILLTPEYYSNIVDGIILAGRDVNDINDLSSNRIEIFQERLSEFSLNNCLYGIGNVYFDSFFIAIIVQYGILGGGIILLYLKSILSHIYRLHKIDNTIFITTFLLLISLLTNSLFEAYPPFGPGTKCLVFWMCYGFCLAEENKIYKNTTLNQS